MMSMLIETYQTGIFEIDEEMEKMMKDIQLLMLHKHFIEKDLDWQKTWRNLTKV